MPIATESQVMSQSKTDLLTTEAPLVELGASCHLTHRVQSAAMRGTRRHADLPRQQYASLKGCHCHPGFLPAYAHGRCLSYVGARLKFDTLAQCHPGA